MRFLATLEMTLFFYRSLRLRKTQETPVFDHLEIQVLYNMFDPIFESLLFQLLLVQCLMKIRSPRHSLPLRNPFAMIEFDMESRYMEIYPRRHDEARTEAEDSSVYYMGIGDGFRFGEDCMWHGRSTRTGFVPAQIICKGKAEY